MSAVAELLCPACSTPLRVRPEANAFQANCPDCGISLDFNVDRKTRSLKVRRSSNVIERPRAPTISSTLKANYHRLKTTKGSYTRNWPELSLVGRQLQSRAVSFGRRLLDPLLLAWCVAGISAAMLITAVFLKSSDSETWPSVARKNERAATPRALLTKSPSAVVAQPSPQTEADRSGEPGREAVQNQVEPGESSPVSRLPPRLPLEAPWPSPELLAASAQQRLIARRLQQSLVGFSAADPVPFSNIRRHLEAMVGVSIVYDQAISDSQALEQQLIPVRFSELTVEALLERTSDQLGLHPIVEAGGITLVPRSQSTPTRQD